jgi:salicylate hydroxylase
MIYGSSMSLEDASVLAKLFSHLRNEEQIPSFLYAYQNLREERCQKNRDLDVGNIIFQAAPDTEETAERFAQMRKRHDEGRNVLAGDDEDSTVAQWDHNRELFAYDAEDEADNWWVQWGLLQERSKAFYSADDNQQMFSLDIRVGLS